MPASKPLASVCSLRWAEDLQKWGGGGGPPTGVFNPPPHRRCGNGVLDNMSKSSVRSRYSFYRKASSKWLLKNSATPLFFSPQELRDHRKPRPKKRESVGFSVFGSIFWSSKTHFKIYFEKTSKKHRKSMISASPNPPKTLLKPL